MRLDMIVVLVLALLFFGGVAFLAWRQRRDHKVQPSEIPAPPYDGRRQAEKPK